MIDEPVSQFMNPNVLHGEPDTPLTDVLALMHERLHSAFIVCEDDEPAGIITERDVVSFLNAFLCGRPHANLRAADVMTSPVDTLPESSTMAEVIRLMNQHSYRRVPIVSGENHLTGIVNLMELQAAMNSALERRGRDLEVAVMARTAQLQSANAKLEALSRKDSLTGLLNRRAMTGKLEELHELSRRYGSRYSVIIADIDHFKLYNDTQGHVAGDAALKAVAEVLEEGIRISDSVYRYGGEEFLIALPESDTRSAVLAAERIRGKLATRAIPHPGSPVGDVVTLSLGVAESTNAETARAESWECVVERADQALYRAKQGGRDCVVESNESSNVMHDTRCSPY